MREIDIIGWYLVGVSAFALALGIIVVWWCGKLDKRYQPKQDEDLGYIDRGDHRL